VRHSISQEHMPTTLSVPIVLTSEDGVPHEHFLTWTSYDDTRDKRSSMGALHWPPPNAEYLMRTAIEFAEAHKLVEPSPCNLGEPCEYLGNLPKVDGDMSCAQGSSCIVDILVARMKQFSSSYFEKFVIRSAVGGITTIVTVGRGTYGLHNLEIWHFTDPRPSLSIGQFVSIAHGVTVMLDGNHDSSRVSLYPLLDEDECDNAHAADSKGSVVIGNEVWIGLSATILSGVTIGHGAVIGARAVVTKNVAPYSIVVGNPGRSIGTRFSNATIEKLGKLSWWDWDGERIMANRRMLMGDPGQLFKALENSGEEL
jgi:acetyltransferase-like isoleucine patch superfamily enzyme